MSQVDRLSGLSPEELQAVADLLLQGRRPAKAAAPVRRQDDMVPLSFYQEALWLAEQLHPNLSAYNEYVALEFEGRLDLDALCIALSRVVERHEALRARFVADADGSIRQEFISVPDPLVEIVDYSDRADPRAEAMREFERRLSIPFDLHEGPLFKAVVLRLSSNVHRFGWFVHHLVWDGWSAGIFVAELALLYAAEIRRGAVAALPALPMQYADFAFAQRNAVHRDAFENQIGYWKEKLAGAPELIELPTDRPRPAQRSHRGGSHRFGLPARVTTALQGLAKSASTTEFALFFALYQVLVARLSLQDDVVIRTAVTGRSSRETQSLIGFFVNLLPLRVRLDGRATFREHLQTVKQTLLDAMSNRDVPFERIVAEVAPRRQLSHDAIAQVSFVLHEMGTETARVPGVDLRMLELDRDSPINDLVLIMRPGEGEYKAEFVYAKDLFDDSTISRFAARFQALAEWVASHPERPMADLDLTLLSTAREGARFPLAHYQRVMWRHMLAQPESVAFYHLAECLFIGDVDPAAFERAVQAVAARTPAFSLKFHPTAFGELEQEIGPPAITDVPLIDFSEAPDPAIAMAAWVATEEARRFDPVAGPLFRHALLRTGPDGLYWFTSHHHLIIDGVGLETLKRAVAAAYARLVGLDATYESAEPTLFADFLEAEREYVYSAGYQRDRAYWRSIVAPGQAVSLAFRHSRQTDLRARRIGRVLPKPLVEALRSLAASSGTSLSRVLIVAIAMYVRRVTGVARYALGIPVHGRHDPRYDDLIASCMNMLPVTFDTPDAPVGSLFTRMLDQLHEALAHMRFSYDMVSRELRRTSSESRLHRIAVNVTHRVFPGLTFEPGQVDDWRRCQGEEDLTIRVLINPDQDEAIVRFDANAQIYEAWEQAQHLSTLFGFLEQLADPGNRSHRIDALPLLGDAEALAQLQTFNATERDYGEPRTLQVLFEARVAECPDAIAVQFEDEKRLTYAQLNAAANVLAYQLIDQGVVPDSIVAVCVERSIEMVVALLGVTKAGAAYLPLDLDNPPERLQYMLADAAPRVLLTQRRLRDRIEVADTLAVIEVDGCLDDASLWRADNPALRATPAHLAYVIYTSGSTGWPKGAMNAHAALYNRIAWMQDAYDLRTSDVVLQKTNFSFDVSVWEFFWPLVRGARLVLARPRAHLDARALAATMARTGVTVVHFVPSMLAHFLDTPDLAQCAQLRHVVCSGEELTPAHVAHFHSRLPGVALHNLYGPTEAAIDVTHWTCGADTIDRVPIGHPIGNLRIYVLDGDLRPVPRGMLGEIHIAGDGVGRGYWNRPGLTAEKFIADPYSTRPGARMYRTGDLGRWRDDGSIEYFGREDGQIKLRGFRIEVGEIEAHLNRHPDVRESVVQLWTDPLGEKRLIAYVRAPDVAALDLQALKQTLQGALPEHMVPSAIVTLATWPLTPNGKLDRRALPAPDLAAYRVREHLPPQGDTELRLARIWEKLLGVENVGRLDNFFELGGHSLLGIQVLTRVVSEFGVTLPFGALFECRDLQTLAQRIDTVVWSQGAPQSEDGADLEERDHLVL